MKHCSKKTYTKVRERSLNINGSSNKINKMSMFKHSEILFRFTFNAKQEWKQLDRRRAF